MKLRVSQEEVKIGVRILPFFVPLGLIEISIFEKIWYAYLILMMVCILLELSKEIFDKPLRAGIYLGILLMMYVMVQIIPTIYYGRTGYKTLFKAIYICILCIASSNYIKRNYICFLYIVEKILMIQIVISTLCETFSIFNPCGEYVVIYISLPAWVIFRYLRRKADSVSRVKQCSNDYIPLVIAFFSVFATVINAAIGFYGDASYEWTYIMEVIVVCGAYYFNVFIKKMKSVFNVTVMFISIIIMNLQFVVFQTHTKSGIIKFILVDIMHKDVTFTGRTDIWGLAMRWIRRSPIWGYGESVAGYPYDGSYWNRFMHVHGSHNQFLQIMLFGGVVSLAFYLIAIIYVWSRLRKCKSDSAQMISIGLFALFLELTFVYRSLLMCTPMFVLMAIAVNVNDIDIRKKERMCENEIIHID